jgi:ADP-ribosylglycohydrolase
MLIRSDKTMKPLITDRIKGSLLGWVVGDALAVPVHWYYSPARMRADYGDIDSMITPLPTHPESMVQGMSYTGTIDIMHDKAKYYQGNAISDAILSKEKEESLRDDHGNFVGVAQEERVHYHKSLSKGQSTANLCLGRLAVRYLANVNEGGADGYDPDGFLSELFNYMTTPPPSTPDPAQLIAHNDTYLDVYLRGMFAKASQKDDHSLHDCALSQRETWSIGSLDGVVMTLPILVAYCREPESYVTGRAIEHHMLTHRSVTVTAVVSVLVPLLLDLFRGADLRSALDEAMLKMRPPKITGRKQRDSYLQFKGPGHIPKLEKWKQHMVLADETTKDLVHRMLGCDDENVAGWGDRDQSRLSTACYCEQAFTVVLYLAYKYADNPKKALLQNAKLGGHSTARGAILGAILGAAHGSEAVPFVHDLAAPDVVEQEIDTLIGTLYEV